MISEGFDLIKLPYLFYIFPKTGLSKMTTQIRSCRMWGQIRVYTVCHLFNNFKYIFIGSKIGIM